MPPDFLLLLRTSIFLSASSALSVFIDYPLHESHLEVSLSPTITLQQEHHWRHCSPRRRRRRRQQRLLTVTPRTSIGLHLSLAQGNQVRPRRWCQSGWITLGYFRLSLSCARRFARASSPGLLRPPREDSSSITTPPYSVQPQTYATKFSYTRAPTSQRNGNFAIARLTNSVRL
ncbi:hypothetical protein BDP55DRAFT_189654 [Colletotrichum godetiae]|uniref:Secreted protein n=1 Tax=Colletotrichum godetiae TaxID=1209918 RepID=A0AAJ0EUC1_9PEZI|nr:uncharacterized protein BDP55DRAFT_189654 [Colletotrichum godetiae]KAK1674198.1 hypothetical protein BDP55DRAFT_189654 [Colletotrichum godetiae]